MKSLIHEMKVLQAGSAPLVAGLCQEIKLSEIVNSMVRWDPKQCRLSPGTLIQALVINVLTAKQPLYRIEEFYKNQDTELLFGPGVTADALNDDALGRALNKLAQAHPKRVYLQLALSAVKVHGIDVNSVHADTTSKSVYGQYEDDDNLLKITHGYSKDHRPDLKQFLYGLIVNHEGIPLCGELRDGNTSDKTWNHDVLEELESLLPVAKGKCIYVADSALVTKANLDLMAEKDIAFISRLPDTFGIGKELKEWAFQENNWQNVGQLSPGSDKASYRIQETQREFLERNYRFVVIHSTSLDKRKEKALEGEVDKQRITLTRSAQELGKRDFFCEADAKEALEIFTKENQGLYIAFTGEVISHTVIERRPGRPKKGEVPESKTLYRANVTVGDIDQSALAEAKARASTFILVTSVLDKEVSALEVLKEYKEQTKVEQGFRFLKDPVYVDGIYVKNTERVVALGYVFLMSLLIYTLLQRRVRNNLAAEKDPVLIPGKRKTHNPTGKAILDMLEMD